MLHLPNFRHIICAFNQCRGGILTGQDDLKVLRFVFQKIKKCRFIKQPIADALNGLIEKQHVKCASFYHFIDVLQLRGIKPAMLLFFFL